MKGTTMHTNTALPNHALLNRVRIYRPDMDPWKFEVESNLVIAPGMTCRVVAVFENWNAVPGLDMLYVYVQPTKRLTHITPFDLGLTPLAEGAKPYGDALLVNRHDGCYFVGSQFNAAKYGLKREYGPITETEPNEHGIVHVYEWRSINPDEDGIARDPGVEGANQWGSGLGAEEAWRYFMGAEFGPNDDEYDENHLRRVLNLWEADWQEANRKSEPQPEPAEPQPQPAEPGPSLRVEVRNVEFGNEIKVHKIVLSEGTLTVYVTED